MHTTMRYRLLCRNMAICTIDEQAYMEGGIFATKHGNGFVKTLKTDDYDIYVMIRQSYKDRCVNHESN